MIVRPSPDTVQAIDTALRNLEQEMGCRILYACESGSRAWGFASQDSDYDVRFLFVWPRDHYLRVFTPEATLQRDLPGDLDISGWDARMTCQRLLKSNASVLEWLYSPIVYRQDAEFTKEAQKLAQAYFQPRAMMDHYLGLARQAWPVVDSNEKVNGKKGLYALRGLLSAQFVCQKNAIPPVEFASLLPLIENAALESEIQHLLTLKQAGTEADTFPISAGLQRHVEQLRHDLETAAAGLARNTTEVAPLDAFFQKLLG